MKEDARRKRRLLIILLASISTSLIAWHAWNTYTSDILTIDEVGHLVVERPGSMHFEVKPETINITSIMLVSKDNPSITEDYEDTTELPDRLYVVEYECQGRTSGGPVGVQPQPFKTCHVKVILDAYTGIPFFFGAKDIQ